MFIMLHSIEKKSAIREFQSDIIEYRMTVLAHDFPDYHKELVNENRKDLINRFDVHGEELYCVEDEANDAFDALVKALTGDEDGEYERLEEFRKFWPHFHGISHNWWTREYIKACIRGDVRGDY